MATRTEIGVVYGAAVLQGLALVTFPAASSVFTSPDGFGFDSTRYGAMFVPQVALAICAGAFAPTLAQCWSLRGVLLSGLFGDILSMSLLALSRSLIGAPEGAFGLLLVATAALGFGFGATVMALNTHAEAFFPKRTDGAVLAVNALLGLGTALAPVFVAIVVALGAWWLLPVAVAGVMALLFAIALTQRLHVAAADAPMSTRWKELPGRFWIYAAGVFLYGMLETLNGNWSTVYLSSERGVPPRDASFALTSFWVTVTTGRVLTAAMSRWIPARWIYVALPIILFVACQIVARVHDASGGILAFGLAGFACSAFLPLSISFGGNEFPRLSAVMAGELIAFYQLGYGVAAFGIGPLHDRAHVAFATIFAMSSIVAVLLAVLGVFVIRPAVARG